MTRGGEIHVAGLEFVFVVSVASSSRSLCPGAEPATSYPVASVMTNGVKRRWLQGLLLLELLGH